MTREEYSQWLLIAHRLHAEWADPRGIPHVDDPVFHRWASADGQESHSIFAWSGARYCEAWANRIWERIGDAIHPDGGAWRFQQPFYAEILSKFFRPARRYTFNTIMVTPSRLPLRLWTGMGRPTILETTILPRYEPSPEYQGKSIELIGMSEPLDLCMENALWVRRPGTGRQHLIATASRRVFRPWRHMVKRLFQVDFTDQEDIEALESWMVPAVRESWLSGHMPGRVGMAMVQLLRLDESGMIDLLLLEVSHASGLLVDIRWSRSSLAWIIMSDPYFAAALQAAIDSRSRLIRP